MITTYEDKIAIKAILDTDSYILEAGFKPDNILMTKYDTDVLNSNNDDLKIFIYMGTPEKTNTPNLRGVVYRIGIIGKRSVSALIDNIAQQVIALLSEKDIGRAHILYLQDTPLELDSNPAMYLVELSFISYQTIYNKIKK